MLTEDQIRELVSYLTENRWDFISNGYDGTFDFDVRSLTTLIKKWCGRE